MEGGSVWWCAVRGQRRHGLAAARIIVDRRLRDSSVLECSSESCVLSTIMVTDTSSDYNTSSGLDVTTIQRWPAYSRKIDKNLETVLLSFRYVLQARGRKHMSDSSRRGMQGSWIHSNRLRCLLITHCFEMARKVKRAGTISCSNPRIVWIAVDG